MSASARTALVVFGTRPEAIKLAPLIRALADDGRITPVVAVTGQHREILDQVLALFDIVPAHDLDILVAGQTLTDVTTRVLCGIEPVLAAVQPDVVVVQGDTTTTMAGALAAFYARIPVTHLEAGLRSGDLTAPYPEEMNRRLTTQLAALHLAPTATARAALLDDGVDPSAVVVTGNTVIDALHWTVGRRVPYDDPKLHDLDDDPRRVLAVTAHRRESWGQGMRDIGMALARLAGDPTLRIVLPLHPNPAVRAAIAPAVEGCANVTLVEALPYGQFARLLDRADVLLTDSGGVQEEGPSVGTPVLVMRDTTERPEAIAAGTAQLVGTDPDRIVAAVRRLLDDPAAHAAMAGAANPFGDGRAAARCVAAIAHLLGVGPPAQEWLRSSSRRR